MQKKSRLSIRLITILGITISASLSSIISKPVLGYASSLDYVTNWFRTSPSISRKCSPGSYCTAKLDVIYVGKDGNGQSTITANTDGQLTFPVSIEVFNGKDSLRWQMGIDGLTVHLYNSSGKVVTKDVKLNKRVWYPNSGLKTINYNGWKLYYSTHHMGNVSWDVSNLPGGTYTIGFTPGAELSVGGTVFEAQERKSAVTLVTPWHISGKSYVGNSGRDKNNNAKNRKENNRDAFTLRPGDTAYFDHDIKNNDHTTMDKYISINVHHNDYDLVTGNLLSGSRNPSDHKDKGGPLEVFYKNRNNVTITQDHVGKKICQKITWKARAYDNADELATNEVCVNVPYHYPSNNDNSVKISASADKATVLPGEEVSFKYNITNDSGPTKTKDIQYKVYTILLKGGQSIYKQGETVSYNKGWNNVGCGGRGISSSQTKYCENNLSGGSGEIIPGNSKQITANHTVDGAWLGEPGDQICSYIALDDKWSVSNGTDASSYIASNVSCIKIGKHPSIQITGSDSYANGGFSGSAYSNVPINSRRGSYGQYGLLTNNGTISNFGSSSRTSLSSGNIACYLAFANVGSINATIANNCREQLGKGGIAINSGHVSGPTMPSNTIKLNGNKRKSISELVSACGSRINDCHLAYNAAADLEITGGTLPAGAKITVYTTKELNNNPVNVNITGNIILGEEYVDVDDGKHHGNNGNHNGNQNGNGNNGNNQNANQGNNGNLGWDEPGSVTEILDPGENKKFSSVDEIPSFNVVVAKGDIVIGEGVEFLTGNYIVKNGKFITCPGNSNADLGINGKCVNKLKINGAVVSQNSPILRRTFGSGNLEGSDQYNPNYTSTSSEWFNYTPNTWLTPFVNTGSSVSGYETVDVSTLPSRF